MPDTPTLDSYATTWLATRLPAIPSAPVRRVHRRVLTQILVPVFGVVELSVFTEDALLGAFERLRRRGHTLHQQSQCLAALRALFADAVADGVLRDNPAARLVVTLDGVIVPDYRRVHPGHVA